MMKLAKTIPGPKGYPIVGNALMFWGKPQGKHKYLKNNRLSSNHVI